MIGTLVRSIIMFFSLMTISCTFNANLSSIGGESPVVAPITPLVSKIFIDIDNLILSEGSVAIINVAVNPVRDTDTLIDLNLVTESASYVRFNPIPSQIVIPAGMTSKTIVLNTIDDSLMQDSETWKFSISSSDGSIPADPGLLSIVLNDNDGGTVSEGAPSVNMPKPLREFNPYPATTKKAVFKGKSIYVGSDAAHGSELWISDGTTMGTRMVKDIEPGPTSAGISDFYVSGNYVYFTATTSADGLELWQSDGTEVGTHLSYIHEPGAVGGSPTILLNHNGKLYFAVNTSLNGQELYITDGTLNGSLMLYESRPGALGLVSISMIASGNDVYFTNLYYNSTYTTYLDAIFKTDGTSAGTIKIVDHFDSGEELLDFGQFTLAHNGYLYFESVYYGFSYVGTETFVTQGTNATTTILKEMYAGGSSYSKPTGLILNGKVVMFFSRDDVDSTPLGYYITDGTTAGTTKVSQSVRTMNMSSFMGVIDNKLIYSACVGTADCELYASAGVSGDAVLLKNINPGSTNSIANSSNPAFAAKLGNKIIFTATNATEGTELWVTDGTPAGTMILKDIFPALASSSPAEFTVNGSYLYFIARSNMYGDELWITDGTPAGTNIFKDVIPGSKGSGIKNLVLTDSTHLFFTAYNSQTKFNSAYMLDLTNQVATAFPHSMFESMNSETKNLIEFNGLVYFDAMEGNGGNPLWTTNGTPAGTNKLVDLYPNIVCSDINYMMTYNGSLLFYASTEASGSEVMISDGSAGGTTVLKEIGAGQASGSVQSWVPTDLGQIFFSASGDLSVGAELYVTNGTGIGTQLVRDIVSGPNSTSPYWITAFPGTNKVIFVTNGTFWISDGTFAGTVQIISNVYSPSSIHMVPNGALVVYHHGATAVDVRIVFVDKVTNVVTQVGTNNNTYNGAFYLLNKNSNILYYTVFSSGKYDLYKTDGTIPGTALIKTLATGISSTSTTISLVGNLGNKTIFSLKSTNAQPYIHQLWVTDGTTPGTTVINTGETTIMNGFNGGGFLFNGLIYFTRYDTTNGGELWRTDGTTGGTELIKDIYPGSKDSLPTFLTAYNGKLYFTANDGTNGVELWRTNGTTLGTELVYDINPGAGGSSPTMAKVLAGKLYFLATKILSGREVWVYSE